LINSPIFENNQSCQALDDEEKVREEEFTGEARQRIRHSHGIQYAGAGFLQVFCIKVIAEEALYGGGCRPNASVGTDLVDFWSKWLQVIDRLDTGRHVYLD